MHAGRFEETFREANLLLIEAHRALDTNLRGICLLRNAREVFVREGVAQRLQRHEDRCAVVDLAREEAHDERVEHAAVDLLLKQLLCDYIQIDGLETLIDGVAAVTEVRMPRADGHTDQRAVARVIARHLVARDLHGKLRAAIDRGSMRNAFAERDIELVSGAGDVIQRLQIGILVAKLQRNKRLFLGDDAFLQRFRRPAEYHSRGHRVHAELFDLVDQLQNFVRRLDAEEAAEREDQLIVVAHADGLVLVTLFVELAAELSDVDAAHRAADARHLADQVLVGELLAADLVAVLKHRLLEILGGKHAEGVERLDIDGGAEVVILLHQLGLRAFFVDLAIGFPIGREILDRDGRRTVDLHRLEVFRAETGAETEAAEVAVGVDADACIGNAVFARGADADDATLAGARLPFANDAADDRAGQTPECARVAEGNVVRADGDVHVLSRLAGDDDGVVTRLHHRKREPAAGIAFAELARVRRIEHRDRLGHHGEDRGQRADREHNRLRFMQRRKFGVEILLK